MSDSAMATVSDSLARFAVETSLEDVPIDVQTRLKECLLDFVGNTAFAAAYAESSPAFRAGVQALSGVRGNTTVVGEPRPYPFMQAALLNGAYAHTLDFDDTNVFGSLHPGASVIPAALAEAERCRASGSELLAALAVGNEITCRIGAALGNTAYDRGFHLTPVAGIFGAVAAAARLRKVSAATIASAFGIAGSKAAGSMQYLENGSWNKRLHPGFAAHDGLVSLAFAEAGVMGACAPLEGRYGLLTGYSNAPKIAPLTDRLGSWWAAGETALKPYPSCRFNHAAVDAALVLRERLSPAERALAKLRLCISPKAVQIVGEALPQKIKVSNIVDAQFSVYFQVATAWLDGRCNWRSYDRVGDPAVDACAAHIEVQADQRLPIAAAELSVIGASGASVRFDEPLGEASRPFSGADLRGKFDEQAVPVYGLRRSADIAQRVMALEREATANRMIRLLRTKAEV